MEINFTIDFKIIFVASYIYCKYWTFFVYFYNEVNLPTYLPNRQEDQIIFLGGMSKSVSVMGGTPKKSSFVLFVFVLFVFKKYTKEKGKFPKNWETFPKVGPKTSQRFQRDWSKMP